MEKKSERVTSISVVLLFSVLLLSACSNRVYPITTGFHAPFPLEESERATRRLRFVVWANHPAMENAITELFLRRNQKVVERASLQAVLAEQKIRLSDLAHDEAKLLRVGKLVGADRLILAHVTIRTGPEHESFTFAIGTPAYIRSLPPSGTRVVYYVTATVRSVDVETSEVRWTGTARFDRGVIDPEGAVAVLTSWAIARAICPVDRGFEWEEPGKWSKGGCKKKD